MGRHVIITEEYGQRVRLRGIFNDAAFFHLPCVKQWGCFPSGFHAGHFGDRDDEDARRFLTLPASQRDAVQVLHDLYHATSEMRYTLKLGSQVLSYHRSKVAARRALSAAVWEWRRGYDPQTHQPIDYPGAFYRGKFTAVKLVKQRGDDTGDLDIAFYLKNRRDYRCHLRVVAHDVRQRVVEVV